MGSTSSTRRPSFRRTLSSRSYIKETTPDNTSLLNVPNEQVENNIYASDRSEENLTESKAPKSDTEHAIILSSEQTSRPTDTQTDNLVMLKYTVNCKNEHSDPIDIVLIEDDIQISTVVREKVKPGCRTSFEVLVFKKPVGGKVYVHV